MRIEYVCDGAGHNMYSREPLVVEGLPDKLPDGWTEEKGENVGFFDINHYCPSCSFKRKMSKNR